MTRIPTRVVEGIEIAEVPGDEHGAYVIMLHGFGADYYDLFSLCSIAKISPRPTWIFPNGPHEIPISQSWIGRAWFPIDVEKMHTIVQRHSFDEIVEAFPKESLEKARKMVDQLIDNLEIPRSKLLIGGFSQGAILATEVALNSITNCAALVIFSGTLLNEKTWQKLAGLHNGLKFFQSHGLYDPLLPFRKAEELEKLFITKGLQGQLHRFDGGHEIPQSIIREFRFFLEKILM